MTTKEVVEHRGYEAVNVPDFPTKSPRQNSSTFFKNVDLVLIYCFTRILPEKENWKIRGVGYGDCCKSDRGTWPTKQKEIEADSLYLSGATRGGETENESRTNQS